MSVYALPEQLFPQQVIQEVNDTFDIFAAMLPDDFRGKFCAGVNQSVVECDGVGKLLSRYNRVPRQAGQEFEERYVTLALDITDGEESAALCQKYLLRDYSSRYMYGQLQQVEPITSEQLAESPFEITIVMRALRQVHAAFSETYLRPAVVT